MSNFLTNEDDFGWEKVSYEKGEKSGFHRSANLIKIRTSNGKAIGVSLGYNLVTESGWDKGTRVTLYRSGSLFKLAFDEVGLETLAKPNHGDALTINSTALANQIMAFSGGGKVFEAWVDGRDVLFRKKEDK